MRHALRNAACERWLTRRLTRRARERPRWRRLTLDVLEERQMLAAAPIISEFLADNNDGLTDAADRSSDWIEIYNAGDAALDLLGWHLTDDADDLAKWTFPSQQLDPGGYLVVFASAPEDAAGVVLDDFVDAGGNLHTNFRLSASGEYLALVRPQLTIASEFSPEFPAQRADIAYGVAQDVISTTLLDSSAAGKLLVPTAGDNVAIGSTWTGGAEPFADGAWQAVETGVGFDDAPQTPGVNLALNKPTSGDQLLGLPTSNAVDGDDGNFTASNNVGPVFWEVDLEVTTDLEFIEIFNRSDGCCPARLNGAIVSVLGELREPIFVSDPIENAGVGEIFVFDNETAGFRSARYIHVDHENQYLSIAELRAFATEGYGDFIVSDVETSMKDVSASAYLRLPFTVIDSGAFDFLSLRMKYDDGFVAYLNGTEVARRNAPDGTPSFDATATGEHFAGSFEQFSIPVGLLQTGDNLLAIHGLNQTAGDEDFLLQAELVARTVKTSEIGYLIDPTPGAPNGAFVTGFVDDTVFSVDRGFYDAPFEVRVTTDTPGATIVYTTDGSLPTLDHGTQVASASGDVSPVASIAIDTTTVLRTAAFKPNYLPTNVDTQTYLFVGDVINQTGTFGGYDVALNSTILNDAVYGPLMEDALKDIPVISLTLPESSLFGSEGIYDHPNNKGIAWERATSIELIHADGKQGFQVDGGIRIHGRESRSYTKKSFRLYFRGEYGPGQLKYPLFDGLPYSEDAVDEFDQLILSSVSQDGWFQTRIDPATATYQRIRWTNDLGNALGNPAAHGRAVQVFINGIYWGQYHLLERTNAPFLAAYEGGDKNNYDVFNESGFLDGNATVWNQTLAIANAGLANPANYQAIQEFIDPEHYIRYAIINQYTLFVGWQYSNNYMIGRQREDGSRWSFIPVDADGAFGQFINGNAFSDYTGYGGPGGLFNKFAQNAEFRLRFADVAHQYLFNDGALTPTQIDALIEARSAEMATSIVAESARWGGGQFTRDVHWQNTIDDLRENFFPQRTAALLQQYRNRGLYPNLAAPAFNRHGGRVDAGFSLNVTAPAGTIYYTTDGSDPRLEGGAISPDAMIYDRTITLEESTLVKARVRSGSTWSALNEATFLIGLPSLAVSELQYHPADWPEGTAGDRDDFEFIEVLNYGTVEVELDGVRFTDGVDFDFSGSSVQSLAPGQYGVVVRDLAAFSSRYDTAGITIIGEYLASGDNLRNSGERIELVDAFDQTIAALSFKDGWYNLTDGEGFSLSRRDPRDVDADASDAAAWRPSSELHGSPGRGDAFDVPAPGAIVINELLSHSDVTSGDWLELHNTTSEDINIGGWFLSDGVDETGLLAPLKYQIPSGTIITAGGLATFTEEQHFNELFSLNESGGELVVQAASGGAPLGFRAREDFGASELGRTFGRFIKTTDGKDFVALDEPTFGTPNAPPFVGPVVIHEVMYNPGPGGGSEFVELLNVSDAAVSLTGWHFSAISYTFGDVTIQPGELLVVVPMDPEEFRATHHVPAGADVFGPYLGALSNAGESLRLNKPGEPDGEIIPSIMVDRVSYNDKHPWPVEADGTGVALQRIVPEAYGNEPTNWTITLPGGTPGDFAVPPTVEAVLVFFGDESFSIPAGADQLRTLPWTRIERIGIRFSETVEVSLGDLQVAGVNVGNYDVVDFSYDAQASTAVWSLGAPIGADKLLIELSDSVQDESGLPLDGNWGDTTSKFPSGNGAIDNDDAFRFRINVTPGDVTSDGRVDRADLVDLIHALGSESPRHDLTGDGRVDVDDLRAALRRMGSGLPTGSPPAPGSATPQAAVDAVFERLGGPAPAAQVNAESTTPQRDDRPQRRETPAFRRRLGVSSRRVDSEGDDLNLIRPRRRTSILTE
jgi:hypothetical protein